MRRVIILIVYGISLLSNHFVNRHNKSYILDRDALFDIDIDDVILMFETLFDELVDAGTISSYTVIDKDLLLVHRYSVWNGRIVPEDMCALIGDEIQEGYLPILRYQVRTMDVCWDQYLPPNKVTLSHMIMNRDIWVKIPALSLIESYGYAKRSIYLVKGGCLPPNVGELLEEDGIIMDNAIVLYDDTLIL